MAAADRCLVCGQITTQPETEFAGLKGQECVLLARVCSTDCEDEARRFAARRAVQEQPARAGFLVGLLGVMAAGFFAVSGRELGRVLVILGLFGLGTTRLAYPDAIPDRVVRRLGLTRASQLMPWFGVGLCTIAVALAVLLMFR